MSDTCGRLVEPSYPVNCCVSIFVVLQVCLRYYEHEFVELACQCPAVVCCRCSPTQKAQIVTLLQQHTANRTCAIGERWQVMWQQKAGWTVVGSSPETAWERGGGVFVDSAQSIRERNVRQCVKQSGRQIY